MRRWTGTSAPSALPVLLNEPEINFSFLIFEPPVTYLQSLFDAIDAKYNTFMSVVMMLK